MTHENKPLLAGNNKSSKSNLAQFEMLN